MVHGVVGGGGEGARVMGYRGTVRTSGGTRVHRPGGVRGCSPPL